MSSRFVRPFALTALLLAAAYADGKGDKGKAELAWAKQTATDFIEAYLHGPDTQAEQLLSPELHKMNKEGLQGQLLAAQNVGYRRAEVKSEVLAPARDEAVFRGELYTEKADRVADLTIRVTKGADGKWRVSFFRFLERRRAPEPSKK